MITYRSVVKVNLGTGKSFSPGGGFEKQGSYDTYSAGKPPLNRIE